MDVPNNDYEDFLKGLEENQMTSSKEQEKWLTEEFLSECLFDHRKNVKYSPCYKCGKSFVDHLNLDFTDWPAFGLLMTELDNRWSDEEIAKFLYTLAIEGNPQNFPVRAANCIYDFFNGGNDDRTRTY